MKMFFYIGPGGSGKTGRLYDDIIEDSIKNPDKAYFLIVPEQSTMQAQKDIVSRHRMGGTFNIDIVSFNRLAYRVFDELGLELLMPIDDTGKNLVLRKVIEEHKNELKIIRVKETQGFVSEIKSVISELLQYSVTVDMLGETCSKLLSGEINGNERLRLKLMDIMVIYKAFREYISGKFMVSEDVTAMLCEHVAKSKILNNSIVVFDGFTGFTPIQYRLIELLTDKAERMYFTAAMDELGNDGELFEMSRQMLIKLGQIADKNGIYTEKVEVWNQTQVPLRFRNNPALAHLERNIFRDEKKYKEVPEGLMIYSALGAKGETEYVCSHIRRLVEEGYRYRDIGVIVSSMDDYGEVVKNVFEENKIPLFVDNKRKILANPAVEYIRAALGVLEKDYSYESMFRLLKCYMCPIDREKVDEFENYALALGIRGHKKYSEKMLRQYPSKRKHDLERINSIREEINELLEPLYQAFRKEDAVVSDYLKALYDFMVVSKVEDKLSELAGKMEEEQKISLVKEHEQCYGKLLELFEQMHELLGAEKVKLREFSDILDSGFEEIKVGIIPPGADMVMVGDLERTRLNNVKAVYFLGVNEGLVPQSTANKGLFSEYEREMLLQADFELSPTTREKTCRQNFYLYLLFTKPSEKLVLTVNKEGTPSKLINNIISMFPRIEVKSEDTQEGQFFINSQKAALEYVLEWAGNEVANNGHTEDNADVMEASVHALGMDAVWGKRMEDIVDRILESISDDDISAAAVKLLYGDIITGSVSKMEKFAACAFSYLATYGLELEERKIYEIGAADLGTIFHEALRLYSFELKAAGLDFATVSDDQREAMVVTAVDKAMTDVNRAVFIDSKRNEYMRKRIERLMKRTAWTLGKQIGAGKFVPTEFEREVRFKTADMEIIGKIDRIDTVDVDNRTYIKVVDYKSSAKTFSYDKLYDGLSLQLMLYMQLLLNDSANVPSAAFYYGIDDPVMKYENGMNMDNYPEDRALESMRPNGVINTAADSLSNLETQHADGKSRYIPVSYNKDYSLSKKENTISEEQFRTLGRFSMEKMEELGGFIKAGKATANPYEDSCDYCPYSVICGFDKELEGCSYRRHTKISKSTDENEADSIFALIKDYEKGNKNEQ